MRRRFDSLFQDVTVNNRRPCPKTRATVVGSGNFLKNNSQDLLQLRILFTPTAKRVDIKATPLHPV
jgi:hypothetical protein